MNEKYRAKDEISLSTAIVLIIVFLMFLSLLINYSKSANKFLSDMAEKFEMFKEEIEKATIEFNYISDTIPFPELERFKVYKGMYNIEVALPK